MLTFDLVQSPSGNVFLFDGKIIYRLDGTPINAPAGTRSWPIVGAARSLFDWQQAAAAAQLSLF